MNPKLDLAVYCQNHKPTYIARIYDIDDVNNGSYKIVLSSDDTNLISLLKKIKQSPYGRCLNPFIIAAKELEEE